jgi:hypothetical protein
MESELRATAPATEPLALPRGRWRQFREWRRRRTTPRTVGGAIALGLLRLALGVAFGATAAVVLARLLDRPTSIGCYIVGSVMLLGALVGARANREREPYEYAQAGAPPRPAPGVTFAVVGALLIVAGAVLETA